MSAEPREGRDVWRLYRSEWVLVYTVSAHRDEKKHHQGAALSESVAAQCRDHFTDLYAGRVRDEDVRFETMKVAGLPRSRLYLRLPVLKGEFKHRYLAEAHAALSRWDDHTIVEKNSADEHDLRSYGVRRLGVAR